MQYSVTQRGNSFLILMSLLIVTSPAVGQDAHQTNSVQLPASELFASAWPAYRGDLRNTGFSASGQPGGTPWTRATTWKNLWGCPGFASDGTLFIVGDGLYAVNSGTGKQKWHFYIPATDGAGVALGPDGLVYLSGLDQVGAILFAIEASTGKERWSFKVPKRLTRLNLPTVGSDGTVYIGSGGLGPVSEDNTLYALNGLTGKKRWSLALPERSDAAPLIGRNGQVYCLSKDATLSSVDTATGQVTWKCHENGWIAWQSAAMNDEGTIYLVLARQVSSMPAHWDGELVAIDSKKGTVRWRHSCPPGLGTPTVGPDGTLYAGSGDNLYAFSGETGEQVWNFPTHGTPVTSPALTPNGTLYCCSTDGYVYALKAQTGEKIWQTRAGRKQLSSPVLNASGLLFVTSLDQNIYAIRASDGQISMDVIDP